MVPIPALEAGAIGAPAGRVLESADTATVLASFERSFYLDVNGSLVAIGAADLHDGPLNLRLRRQHGAGLTADLAITPGQRWHLSSDRLRRSDGLTIDLSKATTWQPRKPIAAPDRERLTEGLNALSRLLDARHLPEQGLIRLVLGSPPRTATEHAAAALIEALVADLPQWLTYDDANADLPIQLLGLGPGLTPSGDDLLAGLLIAWHHIGANAAADRLGEPLLTAGRERTNVISLAHLRAAAKGYGAAPLHDLLAALVIDDRRALPEALDAAAKIGHSSGFDAIAGVILALTAWLHADHRGTIAA